ncbi:MAG: alpha/beta fold hydrolase [Cumulibacter sp.]
MDFAITERSYSSARHTTAYLQAGPQDGPLLVFCHGWPELSYSWRHVLPVFAGLGFHVVAPDMRGYGDSSVHPNTADYTQREIVADMIELLDHLGAQRAVWIGHDWGSPVVWNIAAHHPERTRAVASLSVPFQPGGFAKANLYGLIDRDIYPEDEYPVGQWDYFLFYQESFDQAQRDFERDVTATVKCIFRHGKPEHISRPAGTASTRRNGGFFRGPIAPDIPRDDAVLSADDLQRYVGALERNGFRGPNSWYVNDDVNQEYSKEGAASLDMPVLFLHGHYDQTCQTVHSRLADPMRGACTDLTERIIDSGHWIAQEKPSAVNAALASWLVSKVGDWWPGAR